MGLTKDYLRFLPVGVCNVIGSANGMVEAVDKVTCAVSACDNVNFYNLRTGEIVDRFSREKYTVTAFRFSTNRSLLAIGYSDGEVHLHDLKNKRYHDERKNVTVFAGHKTGVNYLAFSHDGLVLASGGKDSVIILWDIVNESGMFRLNGHKGSITQLQFTRNNRFLISSSKDQLLKFWNIATQSCFYTISESITEVYSFALLKDDRMLVVASAEVELRIFELEWLDHDAELEESIELNENKIRRLTLTGGSYIENESSQGNTIMQCKKRGTLIRQAKGRGLQLCVSHDETFMICLGADSLIDLYRIYTDEESLKRFNKKLRKAKRKLQETNSNEVEASIDEAAISKDVTLIVSRIGDIKAESKVKWVDIVRHHKAISEDSSEYRVYCLQNNNSVQGLTLTLNLKTNENEFLVLADLDKRGHRSDVRCLAIASNDSFFVSGASESAIIWDMANLLPVNHLIHENLKDLTACSFAPGDKHAVLGAKDGSLFVFDLKSCELIEEHKKAHDSTIYCFVGFEQKGIISCGADKKARFWTYELVNDMSGKRLSLSQSRILELPDEVLCAAISPNGKYAAFGLLDNTARVYFMDTLKFFVSLYGHSLPVTCIDIDPESKLVVTGSADKSCKIWGLDFGDCHKSLFAHDDVVTCVKFGPSKEEKLFWSAGKDGKLKQWDAVKFDRVQALEGHTAEIRALALTSNGSQLLSSSHDKSIRIWELSEEIIVLQEEQELEREKEYEEKLVDAEDIVPGETAEKEADLAPKKSIDTIKSSESILESVEVVRTELVERANDPNHAPHPFLKDYKTLEYFIIDNIQKIRSSHLEKSLLMIPFGYVPEILRSLSKCIVDHYKIELSTRVVLFLIRIHHNLIANSVELLPLIENLKNVLPTELKRAKDIVGFNSVALKFLQLGIEERESTRLFKDVSEVTKSKKKKKEKIAIVKTLS